MIKDFSVLYVGNIDLDNVGLDGTPADDRRYSNERLMESLHTAKLVAQLMDDLGFYALWMAEHHFQREGYEAIPNLMMMGLYLATQTKRLKLGAAFNVVPAWHPIRLAEDFAMADILTDGRVIFGVGRGYQSREVESLGGPLVDNDANREYFEEQMEIIFKAFNEESFSHKGKHFTIPAEVEFRGYDVKEITVVPRPKHLPVEMWQPIVSGRTIDFIAKHGIKGVVGLTGETLVTQVFAQYREACARYGRNLIPGEDLALELGFYLANSQKEAMDRLRPYHDERYKWFAPFGFVRYADEEGRSWGTPGAPARTPHIEDGVQQKAWICGTPQEFIDFLHELEEKYPGLEHIILHWAEGMPREEFMEQLRKFAAEVMPEFRYR
ncbi:MAG: LLM class flavin-dependent oxidoreductase [Chloroflexi bacterium]|nr:LLM class flavin-dependent oxidoreductase [Chloroflexota bacterium]MCH9038585.1 LLM class flavin-dependent oxidoreductase [Chloroflexota bacterium]MCI0813055.1 LLM class flavin-dependent oxidoreductase [Chloroflexota bacterium]MCI0887760.1 LLM class flavin-dependent oxidoreductase [Chloroflexota bacterium]